MTVDLTVLWHTNRRWRAWMDANTKFVTPKTLGCLRHMRNETCEAADLLMRLEYPEEARNNGRHSTVEQELADVAMMALTALDKPPEVSRSSRTEFDIDYLCHYANDAVIEFREDSGEWGWWQAEVESVIDFVLVYPGLDLPAELGRCWRRLAVKHGKPALMTLWREQGLISDHMAEYVGQGDTWSNPYYPAPWLVEES